MLWQEFIALGIVAATVILFYLRAVRRKRGASFHAKTGCGCPPSPGKNSSILIEGKRGERPRIVVREK